MDRSQSADSDAVGPIVAAKAARRVHLATLLRSRESQTAREKSETLLAKSLNDRLADLPGIWLSYRGFSSEIRVPSLLGVGSGVQFAYPVSDAANKTMAFYRVAPARETAFTIGNFGIEIPELTSGAWLGVNASLDPAVVGALVPALGFDRFGGRLGRGQGFYDRFLSETDLARKSHGLKPLFKIGIGFHEQVVDVLPRELHDVSLDAVLTDREWITPMKGIENE